MKTVSVIIPTYNGAHKITNTLRALENQTFIGFEVVVVVDGSTDDTISVLSKFQSGSTLNLRVITQPNGGRAVTRNWGAAAANGDLLIFFDDDTRPVSDCVKVHIEHHLKVTQSILVGDVAEEIEKMRTDFQRYRAVLSRKWTKPLQKNNGLIESKTPYLSAANFSIRKQLFTEMGGFDERLTDAEDFDLAVRASQRQIPIYFNPQAIAWHDDFVTCQLYIRRLRQYQQAQTKLRELKPGLHKPSLLASAGLSYILKRLVYNVFARQLWVNAVDKQKGFTWLPKLIRYRLYDWITTGLSIYFPNRSI